MFFGDRSHCDKYLLLATFSRDASVFSPNGKEIGQILSSTRLNGAELKKNKSTKRTDEKRTLTGSSYTTINKKNLLYRQQNCSGRSFREGDDAFFDLMTEYR